jgi:hypothetical protein
MEVPDQASVLLSVHADYHLGLTADPRSPIWRGLPGVSIGRTFNGDLLPGPPTLVRSRWTNEALHLLYVCPYDTLTLRPEIDVARKTPYLWNWDVAEAFIGSDADRIGVYREFQVSPRGEWVDLAIDREHADLDEALRWNSGFRVKARIAESRGEWYGEMCIPWSAIDARPPEAGHELRLGLFRLSGRDPRTLHLWRPTGQPSFHVPEVFGRLRLVMP